MVHEEHATEGTGGRSRLTPRTAIVWMAAYMALAMAIGWRLGQDVNWDLRNYHFYNPYMLLTGRFDLDVHPAYVQTFLNPVLDIPFYLAVTAGLPPIAIGLALAALHGLVPWLVHLLTAGLLAERGKIAAHAGGALAGITAAMGSAFRAEVGTTLGDATIAVLVLASVVVMIADPVRRERTWLAGVLGGLAVGCKPVAGLYGLGLIALALRARGGFRVRLVRLLHLGAAAAVGVSITGGYWMWLMFEHFGSPLFPFYNDLFRSPFAPSSDFGALYFGGMPERRLMWSLPFHLLAGTQPVREVPWRDARLAVGVVCTLLLGLVVLYQRWKGGAELSRPPGRLLALALFFGVSYLAWVQLFPNYRFALPLEALSGALLIGLVAGARPAGVAIAVPLCLLLIFSAPLQSYGRIPWERDYFGVPADRLAGYEGTTVVLSNLPLGYVIPYFPRSTAFVRLFSNWGLEPGALMWDRALRRVGAALPGRLYVLTHQQIADGATDDALWRLGLKVDVADCEAIATNVYPLKLCRVVPGGASE